MGGGGLRIELSETVFNGKSVPTSYVPVVFSDTQNNPCVVHVRGYNHQVTHEEALIVQATFSLMREYALNFVSPQPEYTLHIFHKFDRLVRLLSEGLVKSYSVWEANYALGQCIDAQTVAIASAPISYLYRHEEQLSYNAGLIWVISHELTHAMHELQYLGTYHTIYAANPDFFERECEELSALAVGVLTGRKESIQTNNGHLGSDLVYPTLGRSSQNKLVPYVLRCGALDSLVDMSVDL